MNDATPPAAAAAGPGAGSAPAARRFPLSRGRMADLMRAHDWSATPLGSPQAWPQSLRTLLETMLDSSHAMCLAWGAELVLFYNDAYAPILGLRHPAALGRPFAEAWPDVWADIEPLVRKAMSGEPVRFEDLHLVMQRNGYPEDTWWSFAYSAVRDDAGAVAGLLNVTTDVTAKVALQRRQAFQLALDERLRGIEQPEAIVAAAVEALGEHLGASRVVYEPVADEPGPDAAAGTEIDPRAFVSVPLIRDGRLRARLHVGSRQPRRWPAEDVVLVEDVAVRIRDAVERAQAQLRLREESAERKAAEAAIGAERERQQLMLRQMPGFVAMLSGPEHRFEYVNDAYVAVAGRRDFLGRGVREVFPELAGQGFHELLDRVFQTGEPFVARALPIRLGAGGAEQRFIDFLYEPVRDAAGAVTGIFVGGYDVTEGVRAQRSLAESELRYRQIVEGAEDFAIVALDDRGVITSWNSGAERITGFAVQEAIGQPGAIFFTPEDRAAGAVDHEMNRAASDGRAVDERWHLRRDGTRFWGSGLMMRLGDESGRPRGYLKMFRDRTAEHEAEARLRASDERYRTLFEAVEAGFCVIELKFDAVLRPVDYRIVEANPAFERQTGLVGAVGKWVSEVAPGLERHWYETYGRVALTGEPVRFENEARPFGRWYDVHAFRAGAPGQHRVAVLFNDITARRRAEADLRELNATLEQRIAEGLAERKVLATIVETTDVFIQVFDRQHRLLAVNKSAADEFERLYGVRPKVGDRLGELLAGRQEHLSAIEALWDRALAGEAFTVVGEFGDAALDRRSYELKFDVLRRPDGTPRAAFLMGYDVTGRLRSAAELERTQDALRQSQKMEAVGQLTGGIAHDFNNMLAVVTTSLALLQRRLGTADARAARYVEAARDGARRAAELTQRLLAFSRQQPLKPEAIDVNRLVTGMSELISRSLGSGIRLETVLADDGWRTYADPNQLENVLLNLAVNARDAMPDGGRLTIETRNAHLDDRDAAGQVGLAPGQYVLIAVADTGCGMPADVLAKAFDPFFTTKAVGKGTGLGLSQVYGFVRQSGGQVRLDSEPGRGTTVKVYLPRLDGAVPEAAAKEAARPDLPLGEKQEVILVVEDEAAVRRLSVEALVELGYRVMEADGAAAALRLLDAHPEIALLFTDVVMPEVNGRRLAEEARRRRPDLRVLFTTGYTRDAIVHNGVLDPGVELIGKPFTIEELAAKVRSVLGVAP